MLNRREMFKLSVGALGFAAREAAAQDRIAKAVRGLPTPKIKDVSVIATAPAGLRLVVVKITTDQDGLYGYGCGTFTQRADLVVMAVEKYLKLDSGRMDGSVDGQKFAPGFLSFNPARLR